MLFNVKTRCGFLSELWSRGVHGVAHSSGVRHGFVLNTRDIEEAASLLASTAVPYTSELLRGSPPFATRIFIIQSPRISVSRVHTSGTMQVKSMLPHDCYGLVLSAGNGTCVHCVKNEVVSVDPATSFLQSPLQDVRVTTTPQFDLSFLRFSRHWLSAELDKMLGMNFKAPLVFMPKVRMNTVSGEQLRDLAENLRRLLCSIDAQEIPNSLGLRSIENNIATLLLESQRHNYSKLLNQRLGALAPWHLRSAEEYMRANSHLPLSLGDICFVTGLNARTLQHWFSRKRELSPMQFLRQIRMERVRDGLLHPTGQTTVTSEAASWGFLHFGRFSLQYERKFGERPSQTLRRSRGVGDKTK